MEKIKMTPQEMEQIENLRKIFNEDVYTYGLVEYQLMDLKQKKEELEAKLTESKLKEAELYKALVAKYGEGTILVESGEFVKN